MIADIAKLKRKMLVKFPFFGAVITNVKYEESYCIDTAGTDGETIYFNPDFLDNLDIKEQIFLLAHEVCHIAFNHILESENKNDEIWNIATDAVINALLKKDGLKMIEGGVDIDDAKNYDAVELYNLLIAEKEKMDAAGTESGEKSNSEQKALETKENSNPDDSTSENQNKDEQSDSEEEKSNEENKQNDSTFENQNKDEQSDSEEEKKNEENKKNKSKSNQVGHDSHELWKDVIEKEKEREKAPKEKSEKKKKELEKKVDELSKLGEQEAFEKNNEDKKKELEKLKKVLIEEAAAGNFTNEDTREIKDIGATNSLIDWRYILKESTRYDVDWSYSNATLENGVINANLEELVFPETEIILDTSGSIDDMLLRNFLKECKNILSQSRIKVGCFDTKFYGFTEIRTDKDIENLEFLGGGGTDFDVAVNAFSYRVDNKIIFTDGYADEPIKAIDAVWIVFGDEKINPLGGKVIYIDEKTLETLKYDNRKEEINKIK